MNPKETMKAVTFNGKLKISNVPKPIINKNETIIRVTKAGICNTDHEIIKGYVPNYRGILGHEFIGIVKNSSDSSLTGKRCTAEINFACNNCEYCNNGLQRHCPNRSVMGIINSNGAMAEYIAVPTENVVIIPDEIEDRNAIFIEPLAAALEILDQISINHDHNILLIGDGKLGILISQVLATLKCNITHIGKHQSKLNLFNNNNIKKVLLKNFKTTEKFDIIIEASGNSSAFDMALSNIKPRGTIILKSTYSNDFNFNPSTVVVNEISIIGSRCGRFSSAINFFL
jgi:threonine dehydrogenase-like Zn-dependent dehydrogenase